MKVFVADKYHVCDYSLPSKVEDTFLIDFTTWNGINEKLSLIAVDGKWTLNSSVDIKILQEYMNATSVVLTDSACYQINFSDLEEVIYLYVFDTPMKYYDFDLANKNSISLGNTQYDIQFNNSLISTPHFTITHSNNAWYFVDDPNKDTITYINGKRAHKQVLKLGDVIFTNGLKIIWMELFVRINNPSGKVKTVLPQYKSFDKLGNENKYTPVKETDRAITLYGENQIFFHTPRSKKSISDIEIDILPPPEEHKSDGGVSQLLSLGTSAIYGISSTITSIMTISSLSKQKGNIVELVSQVLICVAMIATSFAFPFFISRYNKHKQKKNDKLLRSKYTEYLEQKKNEINTEMTNQKNILLQSNLSTDLLQKDILAKNFNNIWSREIFDSDFLTVRLGSGNKKANITINALKENISLEENTDILRKQAYELINSPLILENVPITISLVDNKVLPFIISNDYPYRWQFIDNILLQLLAYHSGMELKLVVLTSEENKMHFEYIKYLSHCYSLDNKNHFFAATPDEMKKVSQYLEKEYADRLENLSSNKQDADRRVESVDTVNVYKKFGTYYLIITDQFVKTNKLEIINRILNSTINLGFSLLMIEPTMKNIPSQSTAFVSIDSQKGSVSDKNLSSAQEFIPEFMKTSIIPYSSVIANIPINTLSEENSLPTMVNFLEMYEVGRIEQLNISNRWKKNDPVISLATPIGINQEGKLFELDLHEKFQGPHGLVAGATGSGKSEFIVTFILSLAVNYHPYEVQFVLIDYKGGGLAGAFENRETGLKIPHLAGTITNLDTSEMNRALVSIKSELKRRQMKFNEARDSLNESTVDIYKYQRFFREGKVKEPISHLFIISDEFAELKSQQPEFMDELISIARIGRSLGVHLILATQKPSGVVNDQIWSNSRFKVCLKVQTAEDSMELLKRREAASIKETGRFYLQVGYNESFELGQSAWAGAKYYPTDRIIRNINDSIDFINNNGDIIKTINDDVKYEQKEDYGDQLTNIVKFLYNIAERENLHSRQLWLPSIPAKIYLSSLYSKYNYQATPFLITPLVGEYDVPAKQFQDKLTIDLTNNGNLILFGLAGSGKENFLMTLIYSICLYHSPEEVNFYIMDFGAEILKVFSNMPHVGDVIFSDDKEKVKSEFLMLEKEINKRRELFSEYGGSYVSYISQQENRLPLIVTVLNGYEGYLENCGETNDYLAHLLRECSKYGIIFVVTTNSTQSVNSRILQSFNNRIAMKLSDKFDYMYLLNSPRDLIPANIVGRGLVGVNGSAFEFQTAYIYLEDQINNTIKETIEKLKDYYPNKAHKIPVIPKTVTTDSMLPYIESVYNVPIGINTYTAEVDRFNFGNEKIPVIIGKTAVINNTFVTSLIEILTSIPDIHLKIIDFAGSLKAGADYDYYNGNFTDTINGIVETNDSTKIKVVYLINGVSYIYDKVLDEGIARFNEIMNNYSQYSNINVLFVDNYPSFRKLNNEEWYNNIVDFDNCIWVGQGFELQNIIPVNKVSKSDVNEIESDTIFKVTNKEYTVDKGLSSGATSSGGSGLLGTSTGGGGFL